jgi:hypothetical protein
MLLPIVYDARSLHGCRQSRETYAFGAGGEGREHSVEIIDI